MERIARSIQNKKQDKIALVQIQPSVNSLREGEEVLFNNSNGMLVRYRKQNGRLWSSNMTDNGNMLVDKKIALFITKHFLIILKKIYEVEHTIYLGGRLEKQQVWKL